MSTFPRGFGASAAGIDPSSFHPLFRFLDDFDNYNQHTSTGKDHRGHSLRTFSPKFDVRETAANYELHGELPGIEQKDIEIEFTDGQTLVIHGRTERSYTEGTHPAGLSIEDKKSDQSESQRQPTVEDDEEDGAKKLEKSGSANTSTTATRYKEGAQHQQPHAKYWVSERSVGEFSRSFNFPANVDRDAVTASIKNGILSVIVPKAKKAGGRKIQITS